MYASKSLGLIDVEVFSITTGFPYRGCNGAWASQGKSAQITEGSSMGYWDHLWVILIPGLNTAWRRIIRSVPAYAVGTRNFSM